MVLYIRNSTLSKVMFKIPKGFTNCISYTIIKHIENRLSSNILQASAVLVWGSQFNATLTLGKCKSR